MRRRQYLVGPVPMRITMPAMRITGTMSMLARCSRRPRLEHQHYADQHRPNQWPERQRRNQKEKRGEEFLHVR